MARTFYSSRAGTNRNATGFALDVVKTHFLELFKELRSDGFFDEYLGWVCVDDGPIEGKIRNPASDIFLKVRTQDLWPIEDRYLFYNEDDFFDVVEYLYTCVSKPVSGTFHHFSQCGMHWEKFDRVEGQATYVQRVNEVIGLYYEPFELSTDGQVLRAVEEGFQTLVDANAPTTDKNILSKVNNATSRFRRHGSSIEERRIAVRELADILEYLRPSLKKAIGKKDEDDLFNIANNFGIRHYNEKQKTGYDAALWLSWMFYFYLATIHLAFRKIGSM